MFAFTIEAYKVASQSDCRVNLVLHLALRKRRERCAYFIQ